MDRFFVRIFERELDAMIHCLMRWRSRIQNARSNEATLSRQEERSETARHEVRGVYDRSPFRCIVHRIADTPAAEAISSSRSCGTQREALDRESKRTKSAGETSFESESHFYSFISSISCPYTIKGNTTRNGSSRFDRFVAAARTIETSS